MKNKVLVAMSGGVDSSVALALLKSKGFNVIGATMLLNDHMQKAIDDAKLVAEKIGVEHIVLDYREYFNKEIEQYFIDTYLEGKTPNPCIRCNKLIKFGKLLDDAKKLGCDRISTGHYINVIKDEELNRYYLKKTEASSKDQTYFLYRLSQDQLKHMITPLNDFTKDDVRKMASEFGLHIAEKSDSQEICFIEDDDYKKYINENISRDVKEGLFVDKKGKVLGKHKGIINYTIGQRKGLEIALGKPMFVIKIDIERNQVVLGEKQDCLGREIIIDDINLMYSDKIEEGQRVKCKIRSAMKEQDASIFMINKNEIKIVFDEPIWAPTPGQSAVMYVDGIVLGGGIIKEVYLDKDL